MMIYIIYNSLYNIYKYIHTYIKKNICIAFEIKFQSFYKGRKKQTILTIKSNPDIIRHIG